MVFICLVQDLRNALPGEPGLVRNGFGVNVFFVQQDYPIFGSVPETNFDCLGKVHGGYYSDIEAGCQVGTTRSRNTNKHTKSGLSRLRPRDIQVSTLQLPLPQWHTL